MRALLLKVQQILSELNTHVVVSYGLYGSNFWLIWLYNKFSTIIQKFLFFYERSFGLYFSSIVLAHFYLFMGLAIVSVMVRGFYPSIWAAYEVFWEEVASSDKPLYDLLLNRNVYYQALNVWGVAFRQSILILYSDIVISCNEFIWWLIFQIFLFLSIIIPVLIGVAYLTLAERKIMAAMQRRVGPNVIGVWGLIQPLADGLKLVVKQTIVPNKAQRNLFLFAPVYTFALALSAWAVIPFNKNIVLANLELGVIYLLAISTLGVYGLIIAGWSSNSKYAFLGALRAAAQIISYDVSIGLILLCLLLSTSTCNLTAIVEFQANLWFIVVYWPLAIIFFISILAETNRSPFDLTEAEAELVSGYNVEYSAVGFALFFLAEYSNILMISVYFSLLFLGGWHAPFWLNFWFVPGSLWLGLKTAFVAYMFIWVRATVPRYRYDQLMALGWKVFLPLSLGFFVCINCIQIMFIFFGANFIVNYVNIQWILGSIFLVYYIVAGIYLSMRMWDVFMLRRKLTILVEALGNSRFLVVVLISLDLVMGDVIG